MADYRSPSQLNEYERCPHAYYLNRRMRAYKVPAPWLAHGTAVHAALERWWNLRHTMTPEQAQEDALRHFRQHYGAMIAIDLRETPNLRMWERSGPYAASVDIPRRFQVGQEHVLNVLGYYAKHPELTPWVDPEGSMWVEKRFKVKFGEVEVVGYVDIVHDAIPYDYKTGATPGGDEQLATYAGVLNLKYDTPFTNAFYFMAKAGKPTQPYDISGWSVERLADVYGSLDENIKAERFDPKPDPDVCPRCPVRHACEFKEV